VFPQLCESFSVFVGNQLLSVSGELNLPSLDCLFGATTRLLDVLNGDDDSSSLLASGDSVIQDPDVVVYSVFSDCRIPCSHLLVDFFAWARLVIDLDDSLASLLADGPSVAPNLESLLVVSLDLDSDNCDLLVVLLDLLSPLVDVFVVAAALSVLHDDYRSACPGASGDSGSEDVLVLNKSLNLNSPVDESHLSALDSNRDGWAGTDSLDSDLQSIYSGSALMNSDSWGWKSTDSDDRS
jgi:hypothetical protein